MPNISLPSITGIHSADCYIGKVSSGNNTSFAIKHITPTVTHVVLGTFAINVNSLGH